MPDATPLSLEDEVKQLEDQVEGLKSRIADALQTNELIVSLTRDIFDTANARLKFQEKRVDECYRRIIPPEQQVITYIDEELLAAIERVRKDD